MRPIRLLLIPLLLAALTTGCGHDARSVPASAVAVVGDRTITRAQLRTVMAQSRQAYIARGASFPAAGTKEYGRIQQSAVRVLVERAELEQKAPGLGVQVDEAQVAEARRRFIDDSFGGSEPRYQARLLAARMSDAQVRDALRAQLLSAAVFEAVTADASVDAEAVQRYYESHLADYTMPATGSRPRRVKPLATVRAAIEAKVLGEERNRVFGAWLTGVQREFAGKTAYAAGFRPEG